MHSYKNIPALTFDKQRKTLTLGLLLYLAQILNFAPAGHAYQTTHKSHTLVSNKHIEAALSKRTIANSLCLIPNLGSGEDWEVRLKNGHYQRGSVLVQGREEGRLSNIAVGQINNKPAGAALLTWSTGGTGIWRSLILFQKKNGKVRGTQAYDLAFPLNKGRVTAVKFADNKLYLDIAEIPLQARICANDIGSGESPEPTVNTRAVSKAEALNALVCGPSAEELNNDGSVSCGFQLKAGTYSSKDMTCRIEQVHITSIANEPVTLAVGQIKYASSQPPVFIAFQLKERQGKVFCESCYTLSNQYRRLHYQKVTALKLEQDNNGSTLKISLAGIKIMPSEFSRASYLRN